MSLRVAILCNDRIGLPAIGQLLGTSRVTGIGMPHCRNEIQYILQQQCAQAHIPFRSFRKQTFKEDLLNWLQTCQPDVVLVKTFPWLISPEALEVPQHGFINFHYAPLPFWRGPNPLFWMIRNRECTAGVTVHRMDEVFDNGPVLLQQPVPISPETTYGILCTQLAYAGAQLTMHLVQCLLSGSLPERPQDVTGAQWFRRPVAADLRIDWAHMKAEEIRALVNACNPWNKGAATEWKGWTFGITEVQIAYTDHPEKIMPGTILEIDETNGLIIACREGKTIKVNVVYCEEGFFSGYRLSSFGIKKHDQLGNVPVLPQTVNA